MNSRWMTLVLLLVLTPVVSGCAGRELVLSRFQPKTPRRRKVPS